jgi:uncharacterized membrane protein YdfJ with MMPL/SSD domain
VSPTFHSLSIPNYRIYASGAIVSNVGTWMGRVAQDWLVLTVLTDHSSTALGIVTGLQFLPFLILAPFAGMLVDRFPKRRILFLTQTALLVTALLLAVLLRSVVVAGIGVVLNLLAVGATLGLLRLLFQGDAPLLGGPGEIDAVAVTAIFGVVFALSIDYQVFIVSRVREEWLRTGDAAAAVQLGLARTARVVTGAALSMLGVFFAFGLADVASLRQFGVGLAIAVIIDATLVRLVLLPAALHLAGDWAWWSPKLGFENDVRPAQASNVLAWEAPAGRD